MASIGLLLTSLLNENKMKKFTIKFTEKDNKIDIDTIIDGFSSNEALGLLVNAMYQICNEMSKKNENKNS
jgi:hypothetical protein